MKASSVIASQRVGAKRRPMTGSAKQSMYPRVPARMDCFVASLLAMTEKIFEFGIPDRSGLRTVRNDCA
jgi:hypothetical protein